MICKWLCVQIVQLVPNTPERLPENPLPELFYNFRPPYAMARV